MSELFRATCGGMGLTGIILDVDHGFDKNKLGIFWIKKLLKLETWLKPLRPSRITRTLSLFGRLAGLSGQRRSIGTKSINDLGEFSRRWPNRLIIQLKAKNQVFLLTCLDLSLNSWKYTSLQCACIMARRVIVVISNKVDIDSFFYPLDAIGSWNRIYGSKGFLQYQFVSAQRIESGMDCRKC